MAYYDNIYVTPSSAAETATVTVKDGNYSVLSTESGTFFKLSGASSNTEFTLPEDPPVGFFCAFFNETTHRLTVTAQNDNGLYHKVSQNQRSLYQALITTSLHCYFIGENAWVTMGYGTWTAVSK